MPAMLRIQPFSALRPPAELAADVASVPYDVIDTTEARVLAEGRPRSFLHVVRSEIDLPESTDPYDDAVYAQAKQNLDAFINAGILVRDPQRRFYLYRQIMGSHAQVGLVCCVHVDDYINDVIKKHEKTRKDKEDDRTRHVLTLNANAEPVFLTYHDQAAVTELVDRDTATKPLFDFTTADGVQHTVWAVNDTHAYLAAFRDVDVAYIADGHHRSASAARAGAERRAANPNHTGNEEYNWFLAVLFPASRLQIMAYNRLVKDLNGQTPEQVLSRMEEVGILTRCNGEHTPTQPGAVCFYLQGEWHGLVFDPDTIDSSDPIARLDVSLLQSRILEPILGIGDVRTDKRIDFIGGIRGHAELAHRVDAIDRKGGGPAIAFSMFPTTIEQLIAVSDAGMIMPPKSTWFEPKLRSGLFVHELD